MPDVQYPFIDIAVHPRIRERFAQGEAMVLFSPDLSGALWANGRGAALFGEPVIYDFIETGPKANDVVFRQLASARRKLANVGDISTFTVRIRNGFRSAAAVATTELIRTGNGTEAVLFSVQPGEKLQSAAECARRMIEGFDDPDIHMAVLDGAGVVIAASAGFAALEITGHTTGALVTMAANSSDRLIKRPVSTGKGYLPAAIGALSASPALNLLFAIETAPARATAEIADAVEPEQTVDDIVATNDDPIVTVETVPAGYDAALDAVYAIEELDEEDHPASDDHEIVLTETDDTPEEIAADATEHAAEVAAEDEVSAEVADIVDAVVVPEDAAKGFVFNPAARASRFVWKIDAAGRFSDVSHEFADAVGPKTAAVNGLTFDHVANIFDLDPDGKIAELLGKRDTWSGKTIYWPVEGTRLRVPIDLAALPTYTRSREFDGFRGFGIVRNSDAVDDPLETGLIYAEPHDESTEIVDEAAADIAATDVSVPEEEPAAPVVEDADDGDQASETIAEPVALHEEVIAEAETAPESDGQVEEPEVTEPASDDAGAASRLARMIMPSPDEWPEGEVPALRIMPNPARRHSDNVIRVEELRARVGDGLTAGERAAFNEIGRKLGPVKTENTTGEVEAAQDSPAPEAPEIVASEIIDEPTVEVVETGASFEDSAEHVDEPVQAHDEIEPAIASDIPEQLVTVGRSRTLNPGILDEMPVALLVHTGDTLLHANAEFLRLTGYTSITELEEAGGLDALLQRHELDDMPDSTGGMVAVGANDELIPVTARLKSIRWEDTSALMLALIPSGKQDKSSPVNVVAASPEAGAAEQAPDEDEAPADLVEEPVSNAAIDTDEGLRIEVEELRSILETATDGVVILDEDGNIRSMNRSASALFNYDNHETAGKPFVILFAHESQKSILEYLAGLAGRGVASVLNDGREVIGREASGGFLPLFMTIGRLKSSHGYCAVIRDVTHWKRTEDELRNARRSAETANAHKSEFLARVSHEIRTPLNAIIGFADMMATERFGPIGHPRYVEYSNDIGRSGRHVLDIVNDLLDISKIEAGQMDLEFVAVGLNETVSESVSLVQPQANNQRVIIRTSLSPSVPRVVADVRSIRQIVLNILSNAIRFTPSGGQIVVSTSYEANGNVVLRFRDTGIGMTRTELEQAMKPFQQVSSGTRLRGDGTGLGLPLTKAMVDANRATFSINSAPNEGTLVEIVFPPARVLAN